jgi:hypothetical protein
MAGKCRSRGSVALPKAAPAQRCPDKIRLVLARKGLVHFL